MMARIIVPFLMVLMLVFAGVVLAQDAAAPEATAAAPADPAAEEAAKKEVEEAAKRALLEPFRQSFMFNPIEIALIERAKNTGKAASTAVLDSGKSVYIPPRRVISLAGVVFRKQDDWIVWLNGQKVIPKKLLPEIIDINVSNDVVHLKWFDIGMNKIISISLRPHQTYDIVTGLLLPG